MPPTLTTVSPNFGPPGTAITCTGAGFVVGARVGCPALVETTFVSATSVTAAIPAGFAGPISGQIIADIFVQNPNGEKTAALPFTVFFDYALLQAFTTVNQIAGEVPGFKRGGKISDANIENWARAAAQEIVAVFLGRGLSLDSTKWPVAGTSTVMPSGHSILESLNRLGAAVQLAYAVATEFSQGEWGPAKSLERRYRDALRRLESGGYDRLFNPAAATTETGPQLAVGDIEDDEGNAEQAFTKDMEF